MSDETAPSPADHLPHYDLSGLEADLQFQVAQRTATNELTALGVRAAIAGVEQALLGNLIAVASLPDATLGQMTGLDPEDARRTIGARLKKAGLL